MGGNTSQHQVLSSHRTSSRKGCQFTAALRSAAEMSRKCTSSKASSFWLLCPHFPPEEGPEVGITERLPFPWATEAPTAFSLAPFELGRLCEHLPEGAAEGPTRPTARRSECASPSLCPVDVCSPASLSPSPPPSAPLPRPGCPLQRGHEEAVSEQRNRPLERHPPPSPCAPGEGFGHREWFSRVCTETPHLGPPEQMVPRPETNRVRSAHTHLFTEATCCHWEFLKCPPFHLPGSEGLSHEEKIIRGLGTLSPLDDVRD